MPPAKSSRPAEPSPAAPPNRSDLVRSITTPLGFYVLTLLIVEATLSLVLTASKLTEEHVWQGFLAMLGVFAAVISVVTVFAAKSPEKLLYGKEEYREPLLQPSAVRDQVVDLITAHVRAECLQNEAPERMFLP